MKYVATLAAALLLATAATADVKAPAMAVDPNLGQCLDALEKGQFLGLHDTTGERIFFYSGVTYFMMLYPEYMECRAVRYVPAG